MASDGQPQVTEAQIQSILRVRRERSAIFGEGLFSEPAWDILLELFAAQLGNRTLGLADLTRIAPQSTLARWVSALEERGLVVCDGPLQPHRMRIALSRDCAAKLARFLSGAPHLLRLR